MRCRKNNNFNTVKCGLGQDSHRFEEKPCEKPLILGGVNFSDEYPDVPSLSANSDGDVVLHALTNGISGITCMNILGKIADEMCGNGIKDSKKYLKAALSDLEAMNYKLNNISISIECKMPKISPMICKMRTEISKITGLDEKSIGITATSGEGMTPFGRGEGIQVFCIVTAVPDN